MSAEVQSAGVELHFDDEDVEHVDYDDQELLDRRNRVGGWVGGVRVMSGGGGVVRGCACVYVCNEALHASVLDAKTSVRDAHTHYAT